jgi:hypothetical protein
MTAPTRILITAVAIAAALTLAGCTSSSLTPVSPSGAAAATNASVEPVEAYLAIAENNWRIATRAHFAANQDKIASCMKSAGFDYTPNTLPAAPAPVNENAEAWVAKHGYGLSPADEKVADRTDIIMNTPYGIDAPAQTAYVNSLSKAERDAYDQALLGSPQSVSQNAGCMKSQPIDPRFTPAAVKLAVDSMTYQGNAATDPRTTKAQADWAACMVKAGHQGLTVPDDAVSQISNLYAPSGSSGVKSAGNPTPVAGRGSSAVNSSTIATAHKAEIAMALDDYDCKVKTNYIARTNAVLYGLENKWISTHKSILDDVIAGYREASK